MAKGFKFISSNGFITNAGYGLDGKIGVPILQFKGKITLKDFRERGVKFFLARHAKEKDQFGVKVWNDLNKVWAGMG